MPEPAESAAQRTQLGARIRSIRSANQITGKRLAELSRISPAYLSEVERGLSEISSEKLARIADALGVGLQQLISPDPSPPIQGGHVFPEALSEAAEDLRLSFSKTLKILQGAQSLTARRSSSTGVEWTKQEWIDFYKKVESFLED